MNGYGPSVGLPYDEHAAVGLDFALMWWNPDEQGLGKILFDEGVGKFMYPNNAKRYTVERLEEGRAEALRPEQLDLEVHRAARDRGRPARAAVHRLPE